MYRRGLPIGLAVIAVVSTLLVVASAADAGRASAQSEAGTRVTTPVLSPRRAPGILSRTVGQIRLTTELDSAMDDPALGPASDSRCLTVEEGDATIYERRPDQRLIPASTMKVLTGMAALRRLGAEFRFVTEARANLPVVGGVLDGPLWLVGSGDPLLSTAVYAASFRNQPQTFTSLDALADAIAGSGVNEIRGGVVGDESRFDTARFLATWKPVYVTDHDIGPVSALTVNDGFAQYRPQKTINAEAPARHAAAVLTELLRGRGLIVGEPSEGFAPTEAKPLASVSSQPLPEIVGELLRESDNMTAEMLTKELGKRFGSGGTWEEGVNVIRATVAEAGLPAEGYLAVDGSGLDVADRLSCSLLMDALDLAGPKSPVALGFPVAGETGTLAQRFKGSPAEGRLRAKTGSLNFVVGLVGFVDAGGKRTLEFALLANDLPDKTASGRALQERVGAVLTQYPQAPAPEAIAPAPARPRR